ncbi:hypothetical protein HJC23_001249 [Cyclotella cryptica]|uniref:Initiation-specific alpha-1,6-mannosyltransferase n=1 Tax=Cyclotella cryptica TaxID=29204 RepID=A0ABD3NSY0_9STRA
MTGFDMNLRQRNFRGVASRANMKLSSGFTYRNEVVQSRFGRSWKFFMKPFVAIASITIAVLGFGTIYSNVTSRDPCQVLAESISVNVSENLHRLFHFQSKTRDLTHETKTWVKLLAMSPVSQEFPNISTGSSTTWTGVYWSDISCRKLVEDHFPAFLQTYHSFPHTIQRVDSCRYLVLSMYGGVYADTDISIHASSVNEFERLIPDGVGLVESPYRYNEIWQNSLMTASSPGHVFWNITIEIMIERGTDRNVLSSTGPKMIGDAVERFRYRYVNGNNEINDVRTLPCELFQRLPLGEWDTTFLNVLGREVLARAVPMQGCGRYGDGKCEITRHVGKASWTNDAGIK